MTAILPLLAVLVAAQASAAAPENVPAGIAPDIRDEDTNFKFQRGNYVVVPVPISNPTLDTGLVAGAAYFWPQSEEQARAQPASISGLGAMYTSNDSRALAVVQQNYWGADRWRFTGAVGTSDLRLSLLAPEETAGGGSVDWRIDGRFLFGRIARRLTGDWYAGATSRIIDAKQGIKLDEPDAVVPAREFDTGDVRSVGVGLGLEFDSRDLPINSYSGRHFKVDALFNDEALGSDSSYQSYNAMFRIYHQLRDGLIVAWELRACSRVGRTPLWDACTIRLRGFSATDYLGEISTSGQVELRWKVGRRLGIVGFGGAGHTGDSFSGIRDDEAIPSYGAGLRFMLLQEKRVNLRLDYARSTGSDAIYFSVGEAF